MCVLASSTGRILVFLFNIMVLKIVTHTHIQNKRNQHGEKTKCSLHRSDNRYNTEMIVKLDLFSHIVNTVRQINKQISQSVSCTRSAIMSDQLKHEVKKSLKSLSNQYISGFLQNYKENGVKLSCNAIKCFLRSRHYQLSIYHASPAHNIISYDLNKMLHH